MDDDRQRPTPPDLDPGSAQPELPFRFMGSPDKPPRDIPGEIQTARELIEKGKYAEAFQIIAPEAKEENIKLFETVGPIFENEYNKVIAAQEAGDQEEEPIDDQKLQNLLTVISLAQTTPQEAKDLLAGMNFGDEDAAIKKKIGDQISAMEEPKVEATEEKELTPEERTAQEVEKENAEKLYNELNQQAEAQAVELEEEAKDPDITSAHRSFLQKRAAAIRGRVKHFHHWWFEATADEWKERGKKGIIGIATAFALLLLVEVTIIHKAIAKKHSG